MGSLGFPFLVLGGCIVLWRWMESKRTRVRGDPLHEFSKNGPDPKGLSWECLRNGPDLKRPIYSSLLSGGGISISHEMFWFSNQGAQGGPNFSDAP